MAGIYEHIIANGLGRTFPGACQHCSGPYSAVVHSGACPRVKAIEYHPSGAVKRVEFWDTEGGEP